MTQWDYKVVVIEEVDPAAMEESFREYDTAGWELVGLAQAPVLSMVAAFRKPR